MIFSTSLYFFQTITLISFYIKLPLQQQHQQQFAELSRKKLEQVMQQIQEQLQLNVMQQTHILQSGGDKKKNSAPLQQLAVQQQHLIQQFQIVQRQYLMHQGIGLPPMMLAQVQAQAQAQGTGTAEAMCLLIAVCNQLTTCNFLARRAY